MVNKWQMNRAGLLNFWYYDEEIFQFENGKLLLRGSNGSGKSVTMQSFLPVLLDGRTSPERLDPFQSRARRMEDYLLGEKEIVDRDERTGYLFIEFKRKETDQYLTIGIGLQAKRQKPMKFWGFIITDNRRIGIDVQLFKQENHAGKVEKIPLSRIEWENLVGEGGQVVQTKGDYMELVNKHLFGYETREAYEDLIKLLIQLRSPKLSKDFKPTVIYEILEEALPPLTDEDLRHLSDTIEQMDQTKQQIEQLDREAEAINSLNQVYSRYNEAVLFDQAEGFLHSGERLIKVKKTSDDKVAHSRQLQGSIIDLKQQIEALEIDQEAKKNQAERLRSHKIWNLAKEQSEQKEKRKQDEKAYERKQTQLDARGKKEKKLKQDVDRLEEAISQRNEVMADSLLDLRNDAEEADYSRQHELNADDFERHKEIDFDFSVWLTETNDYAAHIDSIIEQLRDYEQLKDRYQEKNKELGEESKLLDEETHKQEEWIKLFEEDKNEKLNEIYRWLNQADWLQMEQTHIQSAARKLHALYEPSSFDEVKEPFRQATYNYNNQLREQLSQLNFDLKNIGEEWEDKQAQLKEWRNKKEPEPQIEPETIAVRQQLKAKGVAFTPFYAAVEFQEHVDQTVRKRIEAALIDSGILNALITDTEIEIKHDRILTANPNTLAFTLADYLRPELGESSPISGALVDDMLRSILIEDQTTSQFSINEEGQYQIGLVKGHAIPVSNVNYIGSHARRRFRKEQIELLETELAELDEQRADLSEHIRSIENLINNVENHLAQFPNDHDLQEVFNDIKLSKGKISDHNDKISVLSSELKMLHTKYKQLKYQLDEQTREDQLELTLASYQVAGQVITRYERDLSNLEKQKIKYLNDRNNHKDMISRLAELEEEMIESQGELNVIKGELQLINQNIAEIERQLEQQGATDIRKQIEEVTKTLVIIEQKLKENQTKITKDETDLDHLNKEIDTLQLSVEFSAKMYEAWLGSFQAELTRGFIEYDQEKSITAVAKELVANLRPSLKDKDRAKIQGQLTQGFYKQQTDLMEYSMTMFDAPHQQPDWIKDVKSDDQTPHIEQWKQKISRQIIELNYQGKQVSPYLVQREIEHDQARQERYLDEQDKDLYEEILFHSVGQKLRARIRRAEQWVKKMKKLMETRDTSSGLTFSIRWKPRTADSEAELDTVHLVDLLRQDPKLLKEEDLIKIMTHFRSRINQAKEIMSDQSELQTLLQVLKEVLDYRKWFSFVLYFQREGEPKRELTNNQFYKFSGGEKAMAMYIPLFTACYSRYQEAASDAPYIISLDEAFAGVDEKNIREMFEIIEQLDFDYMMNSQVLWGDYDTISELAVSELIRPKNADYVTVLNYYWDGQTRRLKDQVGE